MKLSQVFIVLVFSVLFSISGNAQKYNTALGIRFGSSWGMTFKQRVADKTTIELIAAKGLFDDYTQVHLYGEQHLNMITKRLNLYVGGGPYMSFWEDDAEVNRTGFGIGLVTGIELTIGKLNIGYDVQPLIGVSNTFSPIRLETALSLRYMIVKRKWKPFQKIMKWKIFDKK